MTKEHADDSVPEATKRAEGAALKALWEEWRKKPGSMSQAKFCVDVLHVSQGYLPQLFGGMRPITLAHGRKFALHMGCDLRDFSPRLADEAARAQATVRWPFDEVDYEDIAALDKGQLIDLQGRIRRFLLEAAQESPAPGGRRQTCIKSPR